MAECSSVGRDSSQSAGNEGWTERASRSPGSGSDSDSHSDMDGDVHSAEIAFPPGVQSS